MTLARKLQIPSAGTVVVTGLPADVDLDVPSECVVSSDMTDARDAAAVIAFIIRSDEIDTAAAAAALSAARDDRLAWVAYPKARQLGTDLSRDILAGLAQERGVQPVRSVSVNSVWSALRFRPL